MALTTILLPVQKNMVHGA